MSSPAEPGLDFYARDLAAAVEAAIPGWVEACVTTIMTAWAGRVPPGIADEARSAGRSAREEVGRAVRAMLESDIDDQRTTPLALVRGAVRYPTEVLRRAGVPEVERDSFAVEAFPDDVYDLSPATFTDVDEELGDLAIRWGAAKAREHMRRHR